MGENHLPDPEFKFMHEVGHEHLVEIKPMLEKAQ
jgi:hypothetical protein